MQGMSGKIYEVCRHLEGPKNSEEFPEHRGQIKNVAEADFFP